MRQRRHDAIPFREAPLARSIVCSPVLLPAAGIARVGHSGNAYGLLSSTWIDRKAGSSVRYFATGDDRPAPRGRPAFTVVEESAARGE